MSGLKFSAQKLAAFSGQDLSRKGSVDEAIQDLVTYINSLDQYFTTSSCSGRILVLSDNPPGVETVHQKEGCKWVFVSHNPCTPEEVNEKLIPLPDEGELNFKFEAFVLHVQCQSLDDAQIMLSCGVQAGFRNSGISLKSRKNPKQDFPKIIAAIRSTHGIEAPIASGGKLLVSQEYIKLLTEKANHLMEENFKRILRFHQNLLNSKLSEPSVEKSD